MAVVREWTARQTQGDVTGPATAGERLSVWLDRWLGWIMLAPSLLLLLALTTYPTLFSLVNSVRDLTPFNFRAGTAPFIGLRNYVRIFQDPSFWWSAWISLIFVFATVGLTFLIALSLALAIERDQILQKILSPILLLPLMATPTVVGLIWNLLLTTDHGVVNYLMSVAGLPQFDWLNTQELALVMVVLVDVWQHVPFMFFALLAGLSVMSAEPTEAARIDGANWWQVQRYITLPLLTPIILVVVLFRMIGAFNTFDMIYILTQGGPGTATQTLSIFLYHTAFRAKQMGMAAALSTVMLLIVGMMTFVLIRRLYRTGES